MNEGIRLFVDMDGVLAFYNKNIECIDVLFQKGYFRDLLPINTVIDSMKMLHDEGIDLYILSSVIDSPYAISEKNEWLDHYLPEIKKDKRIYCPYGVDKSTVIKDICKNDFLLDDFTDNLRMWSHKGTGIKMVNDINDTTKKWDGERVYYNTEPTALATSIKASLYRQFIINQGIKITGLFKRKDEAKRKHNMYMREKKINDRKKVNSIEEKYR